MLTAIYHPINGVEVVEDEQAERLIALGFWFDSPLKAKEYREQIEREIKDEPVAEKPPVKKGSKANEKG